MLLVQKILFPSKLNLFRVLADFFKKTWKRMDINNHKNSPFFSLSLAAVSQTGF